MQRDGWDQNISVVLWAYRTTCKKLTVHTAFRLAYKQEYFMPMEYILLILRVVAITEMTYVDVVEDRVLQLIHLEEEHFVAGFHQNVENKRQKVWHDKHIKNKQF